MIRRSAWRWCAPIRTAVLMGAWAVAATASRAHAQVDPRGPLQRIETPHVRVQFPPVLAAEAQRAATYAEQAWMQLAQELTAPSARVDLLLADNVVASNGYAQVVPSPRIVIYTVPPVDAVELRAHHDWLQLVITHEMTHVFHLDRAGGLWRVGRAIFARNPLLFPNSLTPSWVKEGLAVHYETRLTGTGRIGSAAFASVLRAATRDGGIPDYARWSLATTTFPLGQSAYAYGSWLMHATAERGGALAMRRFVEDVATFPVPFLLGRASRHAFGVPFAVVLDSLRDALRTDVSREDLAANAQGDAAWQLVSRGWMAGPPRWRGADTLVWSGATGREVTGQYVAAVPRVTGHTPTSAATPPSTPVRVARRNTVDVQVPISDAGDTVVFAQMDFLDPYRVGSDLYVGVGTREVPLTSGARLQQPDVRADGEVIATQVEGAGAHLVRVATQGAARGVVRPLGARSASRADGSAGTLTTDPRWAPDGSRLTAVQRRADGASRVVVLDTLGRVQEVVAGGVAVFMGPTFTPDGRRLVWTSDRTGTLQLETAPLAALGTVSDTSVWNDPANHVRLASAVRTGVMWPSVSPDGTRVAALVQRADGVHVAVAPFDTTGPLVQEVMRTGTVALSHAPTAHQPASSPATSPSAPWPVHPHRAAAELLPRAWMPLVGSGRDARVQWGAALGGEDLRGRHVWNAAMLLEPTRRELDGAVAYTYRGLGRPVLDLAATQAWDATYVITDSARRVLGEIARQRRLTSAAVTYSAPHVRQSASATIGVQLEQRHFTATVDSLLGGPTSRLRLGTQAPTVFVSTSLSTARRGGRGISVEEGVSVSTSSAYRWRTDTPGLGAWRHVATARGYLPIDGPGFARHVVMTRVSGGVTDANGSTEFAAGGVSGSAADLLPGVQVGDPTRTFAVRGVAPGAQRGARALGGSVEYRAPLVALRRAPSPFTVFLDRLSVTAFADAARAWCPGAWARTNRLLCERPGERDGWVASLGAELVVDLAVQYDVPYRLRVGAAVPTQLPAGVPRGGAVYVTLGSMY